MKTLSERFVSERKDQWTALRSILLKIRKNAWHSLTENEVTDFARLYRLTCADLARARTLKLSPDVIRYLNNLVGQAHTYLYGFKPVRTSAVYRFLKETLPQTIIRHRVFVILSALFFLLPYIAAYLFCSADVDNASLFIPESLLAQMEDSYRQGFNQARGASMSTVALTYYIQNNVSVAFFSFAGGILAGLGTIYFLVSNGLILGGITGYIAVLGYGDNFLGFVTAHSVMELSGLIVSGAAGLLLGYTIINATSFYKKDQLNKQKDNIFTLLCAAVPMIVLAAVIEGWLSPQPVAYSLKLLVALASAGALIFYFGVWPVKRGKQMERENERFNVNVMNRKRGDTQT